MGNPYNGWTSAEREKGGRVQYAAFRSGTHTKPTTCELCGTTTAHGTQVHAHCEDYDRPLEYHGLCYSCHMGLHRRYREPVLWVAWLKVVASGRRPRPTISYRVFLESWRHGPDADHGDRPRPIPRWVIDLPLVEPDLRGLGAAPLTDPPESPETIAHLEALIRALPAVETGPDNVQALTMMV